MRFQIVTVLVACFLAAALAIAPQKPVIITFPDDTPHSVIQEAMDTISDAGGMITHEYKLFKGFAAKASTTALDTVKALGLKYVPVIEEDKIVSIDGSLSNNE